MQSRLDGVSPKLISVHFGSQPLPNALSPQNKENKREAIRFYVSGIIFPEEVRRERLPMYKLRSLLRHATEICPH